MSTAVLRQAPGRVVEHGDRAGDVIGRIRTLIKKEPPRKERLKINRTIGEVIEFTLAAVDVSVSTLKRLCLTRSGNIPPHPLVVQRKEPSCLQ